MPLPPDKFGAHADSPVSAPTDADPWTPDDLEDLPYVARFIRSVTAGIVMAVPIDKAASDTAVPFPISENGVIMGKFVKIKATGTTATGIVIQN